MPLRPIHNPARPPASKPLGVVVMLATITLLTTGCFALTSERNHGIGVEANRANLVVYTVATDHLYNEGQAKGSRHARQLLIDATPSRIPITRLQRAAICTLSVPLCISADLIGRTLISWFKSDIRNRGDFWEALSYASTHDRCFAWTFVPRRNLTHKGRGTAGCRSGVLV
jgi:hypothetical protein